MRALNYTGSKARLSSWIGDFFPAHTIYVEPFGGGAGMLLNKPESQIEVYNDLDGDLVNFFRVLREPEQSAELVRRLKLTPFARAEYDAAYEERDCQDAVERARKVFVRAWMSIGGKGAVWSSKVGFRKCTARGVEREAARFASAVDSLHAVAERFRSVVVECRDALRMFECYDSARTLFYVDPPYNGLDIVLYRNGIDHEVLLEACQELEGFCVVSGYPSELYYDRLAGWHVERLATKVATFNAKPVTECLWISPRTWKSLQKERRRASMPLLRLCQPLCC